MTHTPYSPLKIIHHKEWLDAIRRREQPAPIFVQIIPTNRCNQRCNHCAYRLPGYSSNQLFDPRSELPLDKILEIIDDCKRMGVKAIELTGGGEPILHPHFLTIVEAINNAKIDLGLVTNGSIWSEEHSSLLSTAKWVRFSIDAGNEDTYRLTRHCSGRTYYAVRCAIRSLTSRTIKPLVGVSFVVTKDNWQEIEEVANNAYADGADNLRISAMFQDGGSDYFKDFEAAARIACNAVEDTYRGSRMHVFNLFSDRVSDLHQRNPDYSFCGFQQASTYIAADASVYRCCVLSYNERGWLGSLKNQTFAELWNGQEKRRLIESFDARQCPRCMFNNKNATILYAIEENPLHVNFV